MSRVERFPPPKLSWVARRYGADRYCSPACGRGCTREEYEQAVRNAMALATKLGPGWTGVVWENLGWHARAVSPSGTITVRRLGHQNFTAALSERFAGKGTTPSAAVAAARGQLWDELHRLQGLVEVTRAD